MLSFWAGGISSIPPCAREYRLLRRLYGAAIYALNRMSRDKEEHVLNICKLFFYTLILVQFCIGLNLSPELQYMTNNT